MMYLMCNKEWRLRQCQPLPDRLPRRKQSGMSQPSAPIAMFTTTSPTFFPMGMARSLCMSLVEESLT